MRIQHNIAALSAYRNLTNNNSMVSKNLEKLSSGYKINRAGDDAAGLAISEKMRAQITGLQTAQKNANDGISLIQTAEGALTEVHSMLNRMVELATQSANGTYYDDDRKSLQAEVDALKEEIDRISQSTNFNGRKLLDGSLGISEASSSSSTEVGGLDKLADASVTKVKDGVLAQDPKKLSFTLDLSELSIKNDGAAAGSAISGKSIQISIGGATITASAGTSVAGGTSLTGKDLADAIKANYDNKTITLGTGTGAAAFKITASADGVLTFEMANDPAEDFDRSNLDLNATLTVAADGTGNNASDPDDNQAEAITVVVSQEAVIGGLRKYAQGQIDLADLDGNGAGIENGTALKIGDETYIFAIGDGDKNEYLSASNAPGVKVVDLTDIKADNANLAAIAGTRLSQVAEGNEKFKVGTAYKDGTIGFTEKVGAFDNYDEHDLHGTDGDPQDADWSGLITFGKAGKPVTTTTNVAAKEGLTLQIGDTSDDFNQMTVSIDDMSSAALGLGSINISSQSGAQSAVDVIKKAIDTVSAQRGSLGALQNRLEHTINNLSVTTENITAAESRIRDTDMAEEMMAYTKNNILVQASQAMLAQANQIPQGVLQLLQ